ncbi:MAG: helix-turn-helix transcriptional regulator [Caldilineaceae bacterium]|nr:helix-turn-helix transcriptional regulator [Caldilineaceae bacterium]
MTLKTIEENGERYVLVPESDYQHYLEAMEDLEDIRAADEARREMEENGWEGIQMEFLRPALAGEISYLQAFRMDRGMTQQQLAEVSGIDHTTITHLEAGTLTGAIEHWKKLAEALRTDIESLLP